MNVPAERASEFAKQIISHDVDGLAERFKKYGNAKRTLTRLNAILGGEAHMAKGGMFKIDAGLHSAKEKAQEMLAAKMGHPTVQQSLKNFIGLVK